MKKLAYHFHIEKEHIRIQCFSQGFCHLNLSLGLPINLNMRTNAMISILARSVKTTGFETVFKKLRSNKKRPNSQRIVQTCLNHFHGRKCYRRLHGRRFTWQATAE